MTYRLLLFTCYGGCNTGVATAKACIRLWEENPDTLKIGCLPAIAIPAKRKEIEKISEKRMMIDACGVKCGKNLFDREGMSMDYYLELTSRMNLKKAKELPSKELEEQIYEMLRKEVAEILPNS